MLSGLSRKTGLHLLSPASNPVETASTATTYPRGVHATSNELSALESAHEEGGNAAFSACGPLTAPHQEPADISCYFKFPTNDCEITRDGNSLELFHRDDESIDVFNDKPISGNEELSSVMCSEKQLSSISAIMMNASFSEGNKDNLVSGSDCKPFTDNEVSDDSVCRDMSLSTINTVMAVASSSLETGDNNASMFNITSVSPPSAISPFGEVSVPPLEEGGRMKVTNNKDGLDEWPDRVMSHERSSLFFSPPSATSSLENHVNLREREENIIKLIGDGKKPSSAINPCSVVSSEGNDTGLLELEECATSFVNDENGISVLAGPLPFQEKLSSTLNPCLADNLVGKNAGMWELEKCSTNIVNDDNGISVGEQARLVDEVDRLSEKRNYLTSQEKSSSTIGPLGKIANSPEEQRTVVVEDRRLDMQDNEDMCDERRCSPISTSAVSSAKEEKTTNLVNRVDGFEESGHEMSHENPSFTSSSIVTSASMSMVEGNVMKLGYDEDKPGVEDHKTCHREQSSTCGTVTDISAPRGKTKKKAKKINTNMNKRTTVSSSDVKSNSPFQTWLQNFTTFCKTQNEVEEKQVETSKSTLEDSNHQGASKTYSGKQGHKNLKVQEDYLSGNLESCNTSVDIPTAMETDCVPPAAVCSEYVYEDSTVDRIDSFDQEQVKFASDFLNSPKSVANRPNVLKVLEAKENEIYNVKDDKSVSENALGTKENMEIGSEDTYARKRSLLIDNSGEVEQPSQKKLRNKSDSEYKERIERSLDTTWDKSDDLPLMANVDEVLVHHYILDLSVKFSEKIMKGNIVLFLEPRNEEVTKKQFQMTLDSSLVNIESVSEVALPDDYEVTFCGHKQNNPLTQEACSSGLQNGFLGNILGDNSHTPLPFKGLSYSVYGWCVQIWKPEATGKAWPRCVWIKYHTSPEGTSLTWATDQDGK